jgi:glycogen(starch) synthase
VVAGAGVHEPTLRALARRLRVAKSIDWLGFVSEDELPALFGAADVVVVPSLYEPFGIVALEAAVAGAPLVVAQTGGLRDLAEVGVAGESFPAGDVHALTVAIHTILDDPLRTRRMARRAARIVRRNYTWHTVAAQTAGVYAEVVRARGGP